jgi:hypothetical protein
MNGNHGERKQCIMKCVKSQSFRLPLWRPGYSCRASWLHINYCLLFPYVEKDSDPALGCGTLPRFEYFTEQHIYSPGSLYGSEACQNVSIQI